MLDTQRYLYVGFMCHQVIEKILKACYSESSDEIPPYTHNLTRLLELSGINTMLSEELYTVIDTLEPLNIEARYPSYKERLLKSLTKTRCEELISETKQLQEWIKKKL
ncbi:MAG: DNA-binding protein [Bacteroidetes bacterium]|nr:DNA-binding protein [Bacteroidota bacterium]